MRRFLTAPACLFIIASLLLAGCSTYQFVTPTAQWQTLVGQLLYSSPKRSIIGETVVTRMNDDQFQLDFMTGPGLSILKLRKDGTRGRAEAAFARVSWPRPTRNCIRKSRISGKPRFSLLMENLWKSKSTFRTARSGFSFISAVKTLHSPA